MAETENRRLIVSLTSFPERVRFVPQVLDTLLAQTRPADEIVLYLSEDQFPGRESDLPEALKSKKISLRWVSGDLKPHKKYFYAFREYARDIVVTVDDDVLYEPTLLQELWDAHLRWPKAVVAGRTHLITLAPDGGPNPYALWIKRTLGFEEGPSLQLFAVGIGGVLYDPQWFPPELFDEQVIRETCLPADDLWLKAMELAAGIPVVRSAGTELLRAVPGSQDTALKQLNLGENRNDEILKAIRAWAQEHYGKDLFTEALKSAAPAVRGMEALSAYVNADRQKLLIAFNRTLTKLTETREENAKLKNDIELIRSSSSYKLGSTLLKPLQKLKK